MDANESTTATNARCLILAGGEARSPQPALREGTLVPRQFCSLSGRQTLIEDAVDRALCITTLSHIYSIVDASHHKFWTGLLSRLRARNIISHPFSRGTGIAVLHSLLAINSNGEDPHAPIIILPSDHFVRDEAVLRDSIQAGIRNVWADSTTPILLGVRPERQDSELGYIIPGERKAAGCKSVGRLVEKPPKLEVAEVLAAGGRWNVGIAIASIQQLLSMFMIRYGELVLEIQAVLNRARQQKSTSVGWPAIIDLYGRLPALDFSKDIIKDQARSWQVMEVPSCGLSDLGPPARVAETLRRSSPVAAQGNSTDTHPNLGAPLDVERALSA